MKVQAEPFVFLDKVGIVKIPYFQRAYVWGQEQWDKLLADLLEYLGRNGNPYMGTIILQTVENKDDKSRHSLVIDGQQRLTTLSLLLKALFNSIGGGDEISPKAMGRYFGCLFNAEEDMLEVDVPIRIQHSKVDRRYFQAIINDQYEDEQGTVDLEKSKLGRCFLYFKNRLENEDEIPIHTRIKLLHSLLHSNNEMMIVIRLESTDDEQRIFDTMNTAGARLSGADTIKNLLFQKAFDIKGLSHEDVEALYKENWEDVFAGDDQSLKFWSTIPSTYSQYKHDYIEILLRSIATIEGFFKQGTRVDELIDKYKTEINNMETKEQIVDFIKMISGYARLYRKNIILLDKKPNLEYRYNDFERRFFHILGECGISSLHPYILHLYREHEADRRALRNALFKLEVMLIRRFVCGEGSNNFVDLCSRLIHRPDERDKLIHEMTPDNIRVKAALKCIDHKRTRVAKLVLFWIELYRRDKDPDYKEHILGNKLPDIYTLEHIMPISWEQHWTTVPINVGRRHILPRYKKSFRERKIKEIGNMTILEEHVNQAMDNNDFRTKMDGGETKPDKREGGTFEPFDGMTKIHRLGLTYIDLVLPYKTGKTTWDEERITERTRKIASYVFTIWPYSAASPPVDIEVVNEPVAAGDLLVVDEAVAGDLLAVGESVNEDLLTAEGPVAVGESLMGDTTIVTGETLLDADESVDGEPLDADKPVDVVYPLEIGAPTLPITLIMYGEQILEEKELTARLEAAATSETSAALEALSEPEAIEELDAFHEQEQSVEPDAWHEPTQPTQPDAQLEPEQPAESDALLEPEQPTESDARLEPEQPAKSDALLEPTSARPCKIKPYRRVQRPLRAKTNKRTRYSSRPKHIPHTDAPSTQATFEEPTPSIGPCESAFLKVLED